MRRPIPKKISQILPTFQNDAQTSHYSVQFGLPASSLRDHLRVKGVDTRFSLETIGLLCSGASLPGSSLANVPTQGDYQGVVEQMAHTRIFTQIQLEFYVDNLYKSLKFLEHWMEYISDGGQGYPTEDNYYFRMRYPKQYKSNETRIIKFDKNYRQYMEYKFIGLFPMNLSSTRVQYQNSQVLKATCSFSYDRYIAGSTTSLERDRGTDLNKRVDPRDALPLEKKTSTKDYYKILEDPGIYNSPLPKSQLSFSDAISLTDSKIPYSGYMNSNLWNDKPFSGDVISIYDR